MLKVGCGYLADRYGSFVASLWSCANFSVSTEHIPEDPERPREIKELTAGVPGELTLHLCKHHGQERTASQGRMNMEMNTRPNHSDSRSVARAKLMFLKNDLPGTRRFLEETRVSEYHDILQGLKEAGLEIQQFRIPEDRIVSIAVNGGDGMAVPRRGRYVERSVLVEKLEAALRHLRR